MEYNLEETFYLQNFGLRKICHILKMRGESEAYRFVKEVKKEQRNRWESVSKGNTDHKPRNVVINPDRLEKELADYNCLDLVIKHIKDIREPHLQFLKRNTKQK